MKNLLPLILTLLTITGCANHAQIIIDPQDVDMATYKFDLAQCQQLADQVDSKVAERIVGGAVVGAIFGGIIGGHRTSSKTAQIGAFSGGLGAGGEEHRQRDKVLRNCLRNRGYQILN